MRITHISLIGIFTDYFSYQDNLLPKYHKLNGYEVSMITSQFIYDENGKITVDDRREYINENGIKTVRLATKNNKKFNNKFKRFVGLYEQLLIEKPDILFVHGCQFLDINTIIKYKKRFPEVTLYIDNHADYTNSATKWLSKYVLHGVIWKYFARKIEPYTKIFYGVSPARVDFLKSAYNLPDDKVRLLVMGVDDEVADCVNNSNVEVNIKERHNINDEDFLLVTGGKFDRSKKQIFNLMEAVKLLGNKKVKLIIFGSVAEDMNEEFNSHLNHNIHYIGWLNSNHTYQYLKAADLVIYPCLHSVLWEETVGLGKAAIFKYIPGFTHVDLGGNCKFLYEDNSTEIKEILDGLLENKVDYNEMKKVASKRGRIYFSYNEISLKAIEKSLGSN